MRQLSIVSRGSEGVRTYQGTPLTVTASEYMGFWDLADGLTGMNEKNMAKLADLIFDEMTLQEIERQPEAETVKGKLILAATFGMRKIKAILPKLAEWGVIDLISDNNRTSPECTPYMQQLRPLTDDSHLSSEEKKHDHPDNADGEPGKGTTGPDANGREPGERY